MDERARDLVDDAIAEFGNPLIDAEITKWQSNHETFGYSGSYTGPVRRVGDATLVYEAGGERFDYGYGGESVSFYEPSKLVVTAETLTADNKYYPLSVDVEMGDDFELYPLLLRVAEHVLRHGC